MAEKEEDETKKSKLQDLLSQLQANLASPESSDPQVLQLLSKAVKQCTQGRFELREVGVDEAGDADSGSKKGAKVSPGSKKVKGEAGDELTDEDEDSEVHQKVGDHNYVSPVEKPVTRGATGKRKAPSWMNEIVRPKKRGRRPGPKKKPVPKDEDEDVTSDLDADSKNDEEETSEQVNDGDGGNKDEGTSAINLVVKQCFLCPAASEVTFEDNEGFSEHILTVHCAKGRKGSSYHLACQEGRCSHKTYIQSPVPPQVAKVAVHHLQHLIKFHKWEVPPYLMQYKCEQCDYLVVVKEALDAHMHFTHRHNGEKSANCKYCRGQTKRRGRPPKMEEDIDIKKEPVKYGCFICEEDVELSNKQEFISHFRDRHTVEENGEHKIQCSMCEKKSSPIDKERLCMVHLGILSILHHMIVIHKVEVPQYCKKYTCDECEFVTVLNRGMRDHRKSHANQLCDQCGKRLRYSIKDHKRMFCKMGPIPPERTMGGGKCELCDKEFKNKMSLRSHLRKCHKNKRSKRHLCSQCGYATVSSSTWQEHLYQKHSLNPHQRPVLTCSKCPFTTLYMYALREHGAVRHHEQKWPCTICGRMFKQLSKLNQHKNHVHNFERPHKCANCDYAAKTKFGLRAHLKHCGTGSRWESGQRTYRRPDSNKKTTSEPKEIHVITMGEDGQKLEEIQSTKLTGQEIVVGGVPIRLEFTNDGQLRRIHQNSNELIHIEDSQGNHQMVQIVGFTEGQDTETVYVQEADDAMAGATMETVTTGSQIPIMVTNEDPSPEKGEEAVEHQDMEEAEMHDNVVPPGHTVFTMVKEEGENGTEEVTLTTTQSPGKTEHVVLDGNTVAIDQRGMVMPPGTHIIVEGATGEEKGITMETVNQGHIIMGVEGHQVEIPRDQEETVELEEVPVQVQCLPSHTLAGNQVISVATSETGSHVVTMVASDNTEQM